VEYNAFIHVRSSKFVALPGETEELVNDGMYGKAVALYLQEKLQAIGYQVPFFCCEDWGWWVEINGSPFTLGVCIYNFDDDTETSQLKISVSVSPDKGRRWSWSKFRYVDTTATVQKLEMDIVAIFKQDSNVQLLAINDQPHLE